jgi:hypothetical protein
MVPLIVLAVMAARETHAHADRDHSSTVVHTHLAEAALHFEAAHEELQLEPSNDHSSASYLDGLQLTNMGKVVVPNLAVQTLAAFVDGRKSALACMRSENAWAHAPPSLTSLSLRSPPSVLLS